MLGCPSAEEANVVCVVGYQDGLDGVLVLIAPAGLHCSITLPLHQRRLEAFVELTLFWEARFDRMF
jgi:hypothetical protein